ncbi:large conductance mechanosensitive channel protein MscL [Sphingosinicella sp. YJ22]|uniref:large conductance mechanosensitive channel protein MscL n=1 Tax=Sphingosinicella sp. YJ22 TaxID=1104780 RepID=UPI00140B4F52|nr:large conductance mechanosensitive channel protein MscL [Sphingosinicella sp. YJ22]
MLSGFKAFIMRGNVVDLAVAVIIGAAFTGIVTSLTEDVIMPVIGAVIGDADFSSYFILLGDIPASYRGDPNSYAALKEAGVPMIGYGTLVSAAVHFLIVAFIIYLVIQRLKKTMREKEAATPAEAAEIALLREIRDELRAGRAAPSTSH